MDHGNSRTCQVSGSPQLQDGFQRDHARSVIENALKSTFAPEFLNRIDDILYSIRLSVRIFTRSLTSSSVIFTRSGEVRIRVGGNGYCKDYIIEKGWDAQFGARPLKRAIQK
jgi:ATP-dependent Clp protease ATP-binding subunit ClpC